MYAVLYLPDFALQAVLRTAAGALASPAALFAENTKKSVVLAANSAARAAAVELGMTAPQAVARCSTLLIRTPNPAAEAEARAALLAVGFTVSPSIEDTAPGVCTIDLKGSPRSSYERTAGAALTQLEALGFAASAGLGETPLLALYAARAAASASPASATPPDVGRFAPPMADTSPGKAPHPEPTLFDAPARAKKAADANEGPGGSRRRSAVVFVTDPAAFLAPSPIAAADPSPEIAGVLARWGLRTFGDLTALSRDDIGRRLGPEGLALWDRARGGSPRPLTPVTLPETFAAGMDFEEEVETLEPLLFILRRFLERLTLELRASVYVAAELELSLTLADGIMYRRSFRLPEPTADIEILFRTLQTHLDALRTDSPIGGVHLRLAPARPLVRQQGLFETGLRDPYGFSETLARIVGIVGSDRVGTPVGEDTHRPDAVKLISPAPVIPPPAPAAMHPPVGLPLRRFRPPLRAQLELSEDRPTYLWTDRFNGAVTEVRGPWLSSGEWWQADRAWRRTEYDLTLETGGTYRLVFSDRAWTVEGEYD